MDRRTRQERPDRSAGVRVPGAPALDRPAGLPALRREPRAVLPHARRAAPRRATNTWHAVTERRVWKCGHCRKQFSVLTGTIFHGTHISIPHLDLRGLRDVPPPARTASAAREIERKYDLTPKTAWFMLMRIREAMKRDPLALLHGTIVADEAFIGGRAAVRHTPQRSSNAPSQGRGVLAHREGNGQIRSSFPMSRPKRSPRSPSRSRPFTLDDRQAQLRAIGRTFADGHDSVSHHMGEYVRGDISTNTLENYFGQLKRSSTERSTTSRMSTWPATWPNSTSGTTPASTDTQRLYRLMGQPAVG